MPPPRRVRREVVRLIPIAENSSLRAMNTFGVEARARYLLRLGRVEDLRACIAAGWLRDHPRLILGGGSNLLLTRDFPGLVLKPEFAGVEVVDASPGRVRVRAGAGEDWDGFVRRCLASGWYGLENLVRIPGLVGASPIQNIGAYGVEVETFVDLVEAVDLDTGEDRRFSRRDCRFGYRSSCFKAPPLDRFLITAVTFSLGTEPRPVTSYAALREELGPSAAAATPRSVAEAVARVRGRKLPDPSVLGNAGSFFKNPVLAPWDAEALIASHPELPRYPAPGGRVKVAAGWLVERCGWKGRRVGRCGVHADQALILVNHGGATGAEILDLGHRIQASVADRFGVRLEPEPRIL